MKRWQEKTAIDQNCHNAKSFANYNTHLCFALCQVSLALHMYFRLQLISYFVPPQLAELTPYQNWIQ